MSGLLINTIINYEIFSVSQYNNFSEIKFHSITHQAFFNIILVDLLSQGDESLMENSEYLLLLEKINANPSFNFDNTNSSLKLATESFLNWLNYEVTFEKLWFPNIFKEIDLKIKRNDFIKICGNISKHNFTRLTWQSKKNSKYI